MKSEIKKLEKSKIEIEIELGAEEFQKYCDKAVLELQKNLKLDGFRPGKAPKEIVAERIGEEKILAEAADLAIKENYVKAVVEGKIEVIDSPEINVLKLAKGNPFIFKAVVFVLPEINLPDYKKIVSGMKKKKPEVGEKEIGDALSWLRKSRAKMSLKNGPNGAAEMGDFVEIEYKSLDFNADFGLEGQTDGFILGEGHFLSNFENELVGMKAGEEKNDLILEIPEDHDHNKDHDHENLKRKKVKINVKMKSVQKIELPDLTDEFAKGLGDFEGIDALKKNIETGILKEKEREEIQRFRNEIIEKISGKTDFVVPEILIEEEKSRMRDNLKANALEDFKISFEEYLKKAKKTEKELLDYFAPIAEKKVKIFLTLRELGKKEKIEVADKEIIDEVNNVLKEHPVEKGEENKIDMEKMKDYAKEVITTEKIFTLLENLAGKN